MPEVVKIASRIRDEEQARAEAAQHQKAFVDAAAEMELPKEYLERAAAELQATRIVNARRTLRRRRTLIGTAAAAVLIVGGWRATHLPLPKVSPQVFNTQRFELNINPDTQANITFQNLDGRKNVAVLHVDHFVPDTNSRQYFANLNIKPDVTSLRGYKSTSFFSKAAGLPNLRLYLEAGPYERWRSPELHTTTEWQNNSIDFGAFEHQIRDADTGAWHTTNGGLPDHVDRFSFKVGSYMNGVNATGDIAIDDVEIR